MALAELDAGPTGPGKPPAGGQTQGRMAGPPQEETKGLNARGTTQGNGSRGPGPGPGLDHRGPAWVRREEQGREGKGREGPRRESRNQGLGPDPQKGGLALEGTASEGESEEGREEPAGPGEEHKKGARCPPSFLLYATSVFHSP